MRVTVHTPNEHPMAPREDNDLRSLALLWAEAARHTHTIEALVELANAYFETWAGREVAYLPRQCQPRRIADIDELAAYALEVYRCYQAAQPADYEVEEIVEALIIFTEAASQRASVLR
jgi:hypothetical protein